MFQGAHAQLLFLDANARVSLTSLLIYREINETRRTQSGRSVNGKTCGMPRLLADLVAAKACALAQKVYLHG